MAMTLEVLLEFLGKGVKHLSNAMPLLQVQCLIDSASFCHWCKNMSRVCLDLEVIDSELWLLPLSFACCSWDL